MNLDTVFAGLAMLVYVAVVTLLAALVALFVDDPEDPA